MALKACGLSTPSLTLSSGGGLSGVSKMNGRFLFASLWYHSTGVQRIPAVQLHQLFNFAVEIAAKYDLSCSFPGARGESRATPLAVFLLTAMLSDNHRHDLHVNLPRF